MKPLYIVERGLNCRAGGRRFDPLDWTNTQGLKLRNDGTGFAPQTARPTRGSVDRVEMAVPSTVGDLKNSVLVY